MSETKFLTPKQFNRLSRAKRAVIIAKDVLKQIELGLFAPANGYNTSIVTNKGRKKLTKETDTGHLLPDFNVDASEFIKNAKKGEIKCIGCARANIFISAVKFKNVLTLREVQNMTAGSNWNYDESSFDTQPDDDGEGDGMATQYISDEFSILQQALIETAYENGYYGFEEIVDNDEFRIPGQYVPDPNTGGSMWREGELTAKGRRLKAQFDVALEFTKKQDNKWSSFTRIQKRKTPRKAHRLIQICKNIVRNNGTFKP